MKLVRLGACCLVAAVVAAAASAAPPRWQVAPGSSVDNEAVLWEVGRLWFVRSNSNGGYSLRSARVAGGRLADWKTTVPRLGRGGWTYLLGPGRDLVFTSSGAEAQLVAVRLMANGTLGDPVDLGGAPTPRSSMGTSYAQLPDRSVRLTGASSARNPFVSLLAVCCDVDGKKVSYRSFPGTAYALAKVGVDRQGRLWLAWVPGRQGVKQQARVVELDPDTLKAKGPPSVVPGFRGFLRLRAMVCTTTCRLFVEGLVGREIKVASWAAGDPRTTTIRIPKAAGCARGSCAGLIDARDAGDRLVLAYSVARGQTGYTIGTARADSRGGSFRRISSIAEPVTLGPPARALTLSSIPFGALGPSGFAAIAVYSGSGRPTVRVAFLPS